MKIKQAFSAIDVHVFGEVFRIITLSPIRFRTMNIKENQETLTDHYTAIKDLLLKEPRGHRGITGCLILPSKLADYQLLFFHHKGAIPFKQEGVAASLSALLETGNLEEAKSGNYTIETVHGVYNVKADMHQHQVKSVHMPIHYTIEISHWQGGQIITLDHNRTYVVTDLPKSIVDISILNMEGLMEAGDKVRDDCKTAGIHFSGILFSNHLSSNTFQTITFEKDGYIRRTPGMDSSIVCIAANEQHVIPTDPFLNTTIFSSHLMGQPMVPTRDSITFSVRPFVIGHLQFVLDESDPLPSGFLLH